jgi:hypothetical protein
MGAGQEGKRIAGNPIPSEGKEPGEKLLEQLLQ